MRYCRIASLVALACVMPVIAGAQSYHVDLPELTPLDHEWLHVTPFSPSPKKQLVLPHVDTTGARFFDVFYSWKMSSGPDLAVMLIPTHEGEKLYIDRNINGDLSDDGSPAFFPASENDFTFDIVAPKDAQQRTKILLQRKPTNLPDSLVLWNVDPEGNLPPRMAKAWRAALGLPFLFTGKRGTFFFDDRISVRRGQIIVAGTTYAVGLFDYSNNGLFNDGDDILLIDRNSDGKTSYPEEALALTDVFALNGINLVLSDVDRYGRSIDLKTTDTSPTFTFLKHLEEARVKGASRGTVDDSVWNIRVKTIDGDSVSLHDYRGKYLLLNFWGEWCKACLDEISDLVEGNKRYGGKNLQLMSFLRVGSLEKAKKIIQENGLDWPQIVLSDALEKEFNIRSYPTNILILPDGEEYVKTNVVSPAFFDSYIR